MSVTSICRARPSRTTTWAPITGRLRPRRRRRRSGSTAGMVWAYAFNHEEAIRCFDRAWSSTPTWRSRAGASPTRSDRTTTRRGRRSTPSTWPRRWPGRGWSSGWPPRVAPRPSNSGLIEALQARFPTDDPNDTDALHAGHTAYADAMVALAEAYPDDIDVQALAADALVNVTAWALWDTRTGEPAPGSRVVEAKRILDDALATPAGREHPVILHLYLHTMEMSAHPAGGAAGRGPAARPGARRRPPAAHAQPHRRAVRQLPRLGGVESVCGASRSAIRRARGATELLLALPRAQPALRRVFRDVRRQFARSRCEAADELAGQLTPELLAIESPPMADWLEAFVPLRIHVLVRFGRWDELIAAAAARRHRRCTARTAATIHYGRGVAHAAKGQLPQARAEREAFAEAYARIPETPLPVQQHRRDILAIAAEMLDGEIDYREGQIRRRLRPSAARDRARRRAALRRTVGLDAADPARATARCCSSRATSRRPRRCTPPTSGWTRR